MIIVTARCNQTFHTLAAEAGGLLEKPLDFPTLLLAVSRLLAEIPEARLARLAGRSARSLT